MDKKLAMKLLQSIGLIFGTQVSLLIGFPGIMPSILMWIILSVLFLISRFSKRIHVFTEWSWLQFLLTIGGALGIPYILLLFSPGF